MSWTAPKTFTSGDVLTASDLNTFQRDNFSAALPTGTTWQTYAPVLSAASTDPTLGSGSGQEGRYYRIGQLVVVHLRVDFGTSGTAAGSGAYSISLPVTASTDWEASAPIGSGFLFDDGGTGYYEATISRDGSIRYQGGTAPVTDSTPFAWGASDRLRFVCRYEAA